jgi:hypothetical protein
VPHAPLKNPLLTKLSFRNTGIFLPGHIRRCLTLIRLLSQGQNQGSALMAHQQALTTGPFRNTCEADAVSPKVAIWCCRIHMSTTRGNVKWIQYNKNTSSRYQLLAQTYYAHLSVRSNTIVYQPYKEHNINHTQQQEVCGSPSP